MPTVITFAEKVRQLRGERTYREMGEATGLSHYTICKLERGLCQPLLRTLLVLAGSFSLDPACLLPGGELPTKTPGK